MQINKLQPPDHTIRAAYNALTEDLEQNIKNLTVRFFQNILSCKPGCADCCVKFSVLPLEAAIIAERLSGRVPPLTTTEGQCCFLENNLCSIYNIRPIICRTQGLPIGYIDEERGAIEVSCCPLNFAEDYQFRSEELLFLDDFNSELARLNALYCKSQGINPLQRIALSDLIKG